MSDSGFRRAIDRRPPWPARDQPIVRQLKKRGLGVLVILRHLWGIAFALTACVPGPGQVTINSSAPPWKSPLAFQIDNAFCKRVAIGDPRVFINCMQQRGNREAIYGPDGVAMNPAQLMSTPSTTKSHVPTAFQPGTISSGPEPSDDFKKGQKLWLALEYELRDAFAAERAGNYTESLRLLREVASSPEASVVMPGVIPKENPVGGTASSIAFEYQKAIALARSLLAKHYAQGQGVTRDSVEAANWCQKANEAVDEMCSYADAHPNENRRYSSLLDKLVAEDSRSWATNRYKQGTMMIRDVSEAGNGKIVKGYYAYYTYKGENKEGWVEAHFVGNHLSCLHYWDRDDCRQIGEGAGKQMERAAEEQERQAREHPNAYRQSPESSSPGWLTCHTVLSGAPMIAGMAGCSPW